MSLAQSNDDLFLSGDSSRLFINLELGCSSSCTYCYLPLEGMRLGKRPQKEMARSSEELLRRLQLDRRFRPGRDGTILSIGCFSECWDSATKPRTIELITELLPHDNWIQFATKREIHQRDLEPIIHSSNWRAQAVAYVSSAAVRRWTQFERGTAPPSTRFKSFSACVTSGVRSCLYIKPVLPSVTVLDADLYGQIMARYHVDAVVGDLFVPGLSVGDAVSPISKLLHVTEHPDADRLRCELAAFGRVFENSTKHLLSGGSP
jgi:DNA repair photolyase